MGQIQKKHNWMLIVLALGMGSIASAADGIAVKGFVDVQHRIERGSVEIATGTFVTNPVKNNWNNQGALYLTKTDGNAKFFLDLPVMQSATKGDLTLGTTTAQAYIGMNYDSGLSWKAGQYDGIFGLEQNDSPDQFFIGKGITGTLTPTTHNGLLLSYGVGQANLHLLYANANQAGTNVVGQAPEVGFKAAWADSSYRASVGVLMNKDEGKDTTASAANTDYKTNQTMDVTLGGTWDKVKLDVGYDVIQSKYARTVNLDTGAAEDRKAVTGMIAIVSYDLDDKSAVGLRYEATANDAQNEFTKAVTLPAGVVADNGVNGSALTRITLGYRCNHQSSITGKVNLSMNTVKVAEAASAKSASYMSGAVSMAYVF